MKSIGAFLLLTAAALAIDPATVRREGAAYRYPQAGWIVLHIEGKPYDRGVQHGILLSKEIEDYVHSLAAQQSKAAPQDAWNITRTMVSAVFLRKFDPEILEEMHGIADGAASRGAKFHGRPIDLLDIACINVQMEYETLDNATEATPTGLEGKRFDKPQPKAESMPKADHCSAFAATGPATKDGKMVIGHITMSGLANALAANVWIDVKPAVGHRIVMQGFPGAIWSSQDYYMNSAGIVLTETTIRQTRFNGNGTPLSNRCRMAMQTAGSIDAVVKMLTEKNNGLYTNEWLIGDANTNEIAMLELGTTTHRLRRSGKNEWLTPGTEGVYWGCNNTKDLEIRKDTYSSLNERPQDLSWRPSDRDKAWLRLIQTYVNRRIDVEFGKLAFRTPPLAGKPSFDAKVTTSDLAKKLQSYAVYGPPTGQVWHVTQREIDKYHSVRSLIPNDWTLLTVDAPKGGDVTAADFTDELPKPEADPLTTPAWHGTLLPKRDGDVWLTAGFAAYERIVALENALKARSGGTLSPADKTRLDLAMFSHEASYRAAVAMKMPPALINSAIEKELDRDRWHREQTSLGVLRLAKLRKKLGDYAFFSAVTKLGQNFAGREIRAAEILELLVTTAKELDEGIASEISNRPVSILEWMHDPELCVIVYGTLGDVAGNKAAAVELQRAFRVKWTLYDIPLMSDIEAERASLQSKHLLLIGRPETNKLAKALEKQFPVQFGEASTTVNGKLYAHERTAVIAAGVNPNDVKFSAVMIAGHNADATWHAAQALPNAKDAEIMLYPRGGEGVPLRARK